MLSSLLLAKNVPALSLASSILLLDWTLHAKECTIRLTFALRTIVSYSQGVDYRKEAKNISYLLKTEILISEMRTAECSIRCSSQLCQQRHYFQLTKSLPPAVHPPE